PGVILVGHHPIPKRENTTKPPTPRQSRVGGFASNEDGTRVSTGARPRPTRSPRFRSGLSHPLRCHGSPLFPWWRSLTKRLSFGGQPLSSRTLAFLVLTR